METLYAKSVEELKERVLKQLDSELIDGTVNLPPFIMN
jgi:hypothetical protein|tara:strand:+ start:960 stop:1073 length:114 start_codon:yes stop_codon:yes gene_type:complete